MDPIRPKIRRKEINHEDYEVQILLEKCVITNNVHNNTQGILVDI
jgi:hypothetical protein